MEKVIEMEPGMTITEWNPVSETLGGEVGDKFQQQTARLFPDVSLVNLATDSATDWLR